MKYRINAFLLHLCASVCAAVAVMALIYQVWYPYPLHLAIGVGKIALILLAVDVLIGPILTFLIFDKNKKSLHLDIFLVIAIQISAFGYGVFSIAAGRPVWVVFNVDRFDLVQAKDLEKKYADKENSEYFYESWTGPRWIASRLPDSRESRNALIFESAQGGADLPQRVDLYLPIAEEASTLKKKARALSELRRYNKANSVDNVLQRWPEADSWLPMQAQAKAMVVLIRKNDSHVLAVVDLQPWN